jgi:NitT/TauT family transport system permease protein
MLPSAGAFPRLRAVVSGGRRSAVRGPVAVHAVAGGAVAAWLPTALLLAAILLAWEGAIRLTGWPSYLLPAPSLVLRRWWDGLPFFLTQGWITLVEALAGLVVGAGGALLLGAAMAHSRPLERAFLPLAILVKVTPIVAVAPLFVLWFGFGPLPKVLIAALLTFFPMLVAAVTGFRGPDPLVLDVLRSMDASRWQVFLLLRVPSALPHVIAAAKVCATLSLIGAVVAEWVGAEQGLGQVVLLANTNLDTPTLFAGVFTLALIGITLVGGLTLLERRLLFWHDSQRSQAAESEPRTG